MKAHPARTTSNANKWKALLASLATAGAACAPGGVELSDGETTRDETSALEPDVVATSENAIEDIVAAGDLVFWSAKSSPSWSDTQRLVRGTNETGVFTVLSDTAPDYAPSYRPSHWDGAQLHGVERAPDWNRLWTLLTDGTVSSKYIGTTDNPVHKSSLAFAIDGEFYFVEPQSVYQTGRAIHRAYLEKSKKTDTFYTGGAEWPATTAVVADETHVYFVALQYGNFPYNDVKRMGSRVYRKHRFESGQAEVVLQSSNKSGPGRLVLSDGRLFGTSCTTSTGCKIGALTDMLSGAGGPWHALPSTTKVVDYEVDATHFYWVGETGLWRMNRDGSAATQLDPLAENVTLSGTYAFWTRDKGKTLLRLATPSPDAPSAGGCCSSAESAGCAQQPIEACVCAADDYCCATQWDDICVEKVDDLGCGTCR